MFLSEIIFQGKTSNLWVLFLNLLSLGSFFPKCFKKQLFSLIQIFHFVFYHGHLEAVSWHIMYFTWKSPSQTHEPSKYPFYVPRHYEWQRWQTLHYSICNFVTVPNNSFFTVIHNLTNNLFLVLPLFLILYSRFFQYLLTFSLRILQFLSAILFQENVTSFSFLLWQYTTLGTIFYLC